MPSGFWIVGPWFSGKWRLASGTDLRHIGNDLVNARRGQTMSMMSTVSVLSATPPTGRSLGNRLGSVKWVGGRRRGAIGRIALKLEEKFFDLGFERSHASKGGVEFKTQPKTLLADCFRNRCFVRHKLRAYEVSAGWQGPAASAKQNGCRNWTERLPQGFRLNSITRWCALRAGWTSQGGRRRSLGRRDFADVLSYGLASSAAFRRIRSASGGMSWRPCIRS